MANQDGFSRRDFFRLGSLAAAGLILVGRAARLFAAAPLPAGKTAVSETDPMAQTLGYRQDAKTVNKGKFPNYKPNQSCANCAFYTKVDDNWGSCQLFQKGLVSTGGWCASWNLKH